MIKVSLVATLTAPPSTSGAELIALSEMVDWVEVRADLTGDLSADWLRNHFKGRLLYALRSSAEGGSCNDSQSQRDLRLANAARGFDRVELEGARDCSVALLADIPVEQRVVAWHGPAEDLKALESRFNQLASIPGVAYKLVTHAAHIKDEFTSLALLKSLNRADTIAYSTGPLGFWSRLVALHLGSPAIYGQVSSHAHNSAEPAIAKLIDDYGLPWLTPAREIFAIIGSPIFHSLSPRLHNAAYRARNYPALFLPLQVDSFAQFWLEAVQAKIFDALGLPLNGLTVASPHKEVALQIAKMASPIAIRAESANILVRNNGWWNADTTDPEVIHMARRERSVQVSRKRAAVVGCGGAGRAIASALIDSGAGVTLINRGSERGNHAAELLGLPFVSLPDFDAEGYDIVVNATPVGRDRHELPFRLERLGRGAVVIDLVYGAEPTSLIADTRARAQIAIDGRDVLLTQVGRQFHMMTGQEMPDGISVDGSTEKWCETAQRARY